MPNADYSGHALGELMQHFAAGADPLHLGTGPLCREIHGRCCEIARTTISRHLDLRKDSVKEILEEAVTSVLERVWGLLCRARSREGGGQFERQAEALIRSLAKRSLADQFRQRRPEGYRLRCAAAYVLDKHPEKYGLAAKTSLFPRNTRYGLSASTGQGSMRAWDREGFEREKLSPMQPEDLPISELMRRLISWHDRDMLKGELLACLHELLPAYHDTTEPRDLQNLIQSGSDSGLPEKSDDLTSAFRWLWGEIASLPEAQGKAILLRMETEGLEAMAVEVGYAAISNLIGTTEEGLLELTESLPIEYDSIAGMLGITAQQARSRRARGWDRVERRYDRWKKERGQELGLMERWVALLERERSAGRDVAGHNA